MIQVQDYTEHFILGTAPHITVSLETANPDSITIDIYYPSLAKAVTAAPMTAVTAANKTYTYVFQTYTTYEYGTYMAKITVTKDGKTTVKEFLFNVVLPYEGV